MRKSPYKINDEDLTVKMEMHENGVNPRKERERVQEVNLRHPNFVGAFTNILQTCSGSLVKSNMHLCNTKLRR